MSEQKKYNDFELPTTAAMTSKKRKIIFYIVAVVVLVVVVGLFSGKLIGRIGGPAPGGMGAMQGPPPAVIVETAELGNIDAPKELIGHVEAIQAVDIKAQVQGYIDQVHFQEGSLVKAGDLLFTIEQDTYKASVALRQAELAKAQAQAKQAEQYYYRVKQADSRAVSQADIDASYRDVMTGKASVQQAQASLRLAQIDLEHSQIRAPISGRIGKAFLTKGNFVAPSTVILARVVQENPVRVVFSMTDRDYIALQEKMLQNETEAIETKLRLANGSVLDAIGTKDFQDNEMNLQTGGLAVRLKFDNSLGLLIPGAYVTVLSSDVSQGQEIILPPSAILTDTEGSFVYVVSKESKAVVKRIMLGKQTSDRVVVKAGMKVGDQVVIQGVQKVRPGQEVQVIQMPSAPPASVAQPPKTEAAPTVEVPEVTVAEKTKTETESGSKKEVK